MTEGTTRRPPVPPPAERARTIATRAGRATLCCDHSDEDGAPRVPTADEAPGGGRVSPLLHHLHEEGSASVLLPDDDPAVVATRQAGGGLTATLELTDTAPVPLREPIRGLLWVTGLLRALDGDEARQRALLVAEGRPDPRLLDVGHGVTILSLVPASLVLADADGTHSVPREDFVTAAPDPFRDHEAGWLRHLEVSHTDVVGLLARHLPENLRGGHVRPLGIDRFGFRLRVEAVDADHDVRLAFSRPVTTTSELAVELRRLVGCPFLAATGSR